MQEITNPIQAVNETFFSPNRVFSKLATTDNWSWVPFFIVTVLSLLPLYLYFQTVDFEWYVDNMIIAPMGEVSPAEKDAVRQQYSYGAVFWGTMIGSFLVMLVINALFSGYLTFMARNDEKSIHGFTDWYGFTWWTALPTLISSLLALVLLVLADNHEVPLTTLAPLTFAYIFDLEPGSSFYALGQSFRLDMLWSAYLSKVGLSQWTNFSNRKAWTVAVGPMVVIYGIWLVFSVV